MHTTDKDESESGKYISMLETAMENENKEEFRSIITSITGIICC